MILLYMHRYYVDSSVNIPKGIFYMHVNSSLEIQGHFRSRLCAEWATQFPRGPTQIF